MRPPVQIVITDKISMNAAYRGGSDPKIFLALDATTYLTESELRALVAHETGHREYWHTEFNVLLGIFVFFSTARIFILDGIVAGGYLLAMVAIAHLFRLIEEIQADYYAVNATSVGDVRSMLTKLRSGPHFGLFVRLWLLRRTDG